MVPCCVLPWRRACCLGDDTVCGPSCVPGQHEGSVGAAASSHRLLRACDSSHAASDQRTSWQVDIHPRHWLPAQQVRCLRTQQRTCDVTVPRISQAPVSKHWGEFLARRPVWDKSPSDWQVTGDKAKVIWCARCCEWDGFQRQGDEDDEDGQAVVTSDEGHAAVRTMLVSVYGRPM